MVRCLDATWRGHWGWDRTNLGLDEAVSIGLLQLRVRLSGARDL